MTDPVAEATRFAMSTLTAVFGGGNPTDAVEPLGSWLEDFVARHGAMTLSSGYVAVCGGLFSIVTQRLDVTPAELLADLGRLFSEGE